MPESKTPFLIAVDARPLSTNMSGVGRVIHETIHAFPDKVNYRFLLFTHRPIHSSHSALLGLPNVVVYQGKGLLASRGAIYFNIYLPYIIRRIPIDLFWGSQQFIPPLLPKKIRVVLTFYDLVLYFFPGTMRKIAAFQQQLFQNLSVSRADFILSISKQTRDDMIRRFHYDKKKTGIAYPAVDFHQIKMLMKQKPTKRITSIKAPYILSVSTIEPRKNYPFLLKVYREYRILNKKKHWKWVIAGKIGWENPLFIDELKKEIEDFGDIIHIDSPTDIELHHLYRNCSLFLFASVYEGFGIPLLEAMAHEKYSIVSDIPTFREIGKDRIRYLGLESTRKWAGEIVKFMNKPKKVKFHPEEFTWEESARITKNAFDLLLK